MKGVQVKLGKDHSHADAPQEVEGFLVRDGGPDQQTKPLLREYRTYLGLDETKKEKVD